MRKIALLITALLISLNVSAGSSDLGSAISKGLDRNTSNNLAGPAMIYGGKDLSHSIVA